MRIHRTLPLIVLAVAAFVGPVAAGTIVLSGGPGTPCADDPTGGCFSSTSVKPGTLSLFDLINDPGTVDLGIFVVPGDVVMFERPNGSLTDPATWSDVVRFETGPNSSTATIFADDENGVILPPDFVLSLNALSILEVQTGNGDDSDFTVYTAGSATYNIHSDAALDPEPEEPTEGTPEPATVGLLAGGLLVVAARARIIAAKKS